MCFEQRRKPLCEFCQPAKLLHAAHFKKYKSNCVAASHLPSMRLNVPALSHQDGAPCGQDEQTARADGIDEDSQGDDVVMVFDIFDQHAGRRANDDSA